MENRKYRRFTRTALLLALTVVLQSLRLFIPVPPVFSTFVIGSFVNACLLVSTEQGGLRPALLIAIVAPLVAWFQQLLPVPLLVLPVIAANIAYVAIFSYFLSKQRWLGLIAAAICKTILLYISVSYLLTVIVLPPKVAAGITFVMSWPQLVTAVLGGILAFGIVRRIRSFD